MVQHTSNYTDKVGIRGSNYTDLVGKYTSNYDDKFGIWGSNYTDLGGKYTSNYTDKVGIWGSNYTDLQEKYTSNYVDRINTTLTTTFGLKQDVLTSITPVKGPYTFNITSYKNYFTVIQYPNIFQTSFWYNTSDRNRNLIKGGYTTNPLVAGPMYKITLNYNTGDKITFKNTIDGLSDNLIDNATGVTHQHFFQ